MELTGEMKRKRRTLRHAHPSNDPQECSASRQGDIALIHSAPTGEKILMMKRRACASRIMRLPIVAAVAEFFSVPRVRGPLAAVSGEERGLSQCPLWVFFIAASCSALAAP
jgi:hypothetical protein